MSRDREGAAFSLNHPKLIGVQGPRRGDNFPSTVEDASATTTPVGELAPLTAISLATPRRVGDAIKHRLSL